MVLRKLKKSGVRHGARGRERDSVEVCENPEISDIRQRGLDSGESAVLLILTLAQAGGESRSLTHWISEVLLGTKREQDSERPVFYNCQDSNTSSLHSLSESQGIPCPES